MSRGLGKIERAILDDITIGGPSSVLIHSWGLLCHHNCFRRSAYWNFEPTTAERKAVTRAMRSFVRKFPQYALTGVDWHRKGPQGVSQKWRAFRPVSASCR